LVAIIGRDPHSILFAHTFEEAPDGRLAWLFDSHSNTMETDLKRRFSNRVFAWAPDWSRQNGFNTENYEETTK
jgi:hypothetical protein